MPPLLVLPDNTVLVNFALINRMDLLARLVANGAWCASVAAECDASAAQPGLASMAEAYEIFGEPLRPESVTEHVMIQTLRTLLARPGEARHRHLGEAETLAIMSCRSLRGIFATDDTAVPALAQQQDIKVITTFDLLRAAYRGKMVDADTLWSYVETLRSKRRGGPPGVYGRRAFEDWLAA
jgi:predicted nucleic acid-binding protein